MRRMRPTQLLCSVVCIVRCIRCDTFWMQWKEARPGRHIDEWAYVAVSFTSAFPFLFGWLLLQPLALACC